MNSNEYFYISLTLMVSEKKDFNKKTSPLKQATKSSASKVAGKVSKNKSPQKNTKPSQPSGTPKLQTREIDSGKYNNHIDTTHSGFSVKRIGTLEDQQSKKKVPNRILLIFIFSIVLLIFAFYKISLQKIQDFSISENLSQLPDPSTINAQNEREYYPLEEAKMTDTTITDPSQPFSKEKDLDLITQFYSAFGQIDIETMNNYVDPLLQRTSIWQQFRSKKNIITFISHVDDTLVLGNLFLIPGSVDEQKKTRQYSYRISYTLNSQQEFEEDRIIKLKDISEGTKVAEIFCETKKCSSSPFFRPQNYGIK